MDLHQAEIRVQELRAQLNEHNRRYYAENAPVISDFQYDMLMNELIDLEKTYPSLLTPDSPTQKVGNDLLNEFEQFPHKYPMLSLGNTYDITEVQAFAARAEKSLGAEKFTYSCELKFDGTAICLTYKHGQLFRALTRGDGTYGDDVTANAKHIKNIPLRLSGEGWPEEFEIRGEVLMPYKAFDRLNQERIDNEDQPFANPRNAASGSLKLLNPKEVAHRGLECTLYHILGENLPFKTHDEALSAAALWGLPVSDKRRIVSNIAGIQTYINYWDIERKALPFATDGIVIKINEIPFHETLGYTAKSPRWAVAYKFKAEQALSRVLSIDYQVGRTGAITPVANLEPKLLSGTIVKRASLHNADQMALLDIHIGDYAYVEKGGEIIPKITGVELGERDENAVRPVFPTHCPDCGAELKRDEGEAKFFCPNSDGCPKQIMGKLVHFISRKAMNVLAGDATVEQLYKKGLVASPADLYALTAAKLSGMEGWRERSIERFLSSLRDSKKVSFEHVLFALGIRHIGETTASSLARHFGSIDALAAASREELLGVEDVGEVIADSILDYFAKPEHQEQIQRLKDAGLKFKIDQAVISASNVLGGKVFVVSGNFSISRDDIKGLIASNGGKNSSSLSRNTAYLLAGSKPGPEKIKKAAELGIPLLSEDEFMEMIGEITLVEEPQAGDQLALW